MIKLTSFLLCLFPYLTFAATTLTIDQVEGEGGSITVYYTVVDVSGDLFETVNWQYSLDDGCSGRSRRDNATFARGRC